MSYFSDLEFSRPFLDKWHEENLLQKHIRMKLQYYLPFIFLATLSGIYAQVGSDASRLSIDRIFASGEFYQDTQAEIHWTDDGESYAVLETNAQGVTELAQYETKSQARSLLLSATMLTPEGQKEPLSVAEFSLSNDESKVLIFTNTSRVWRSNTKGDYWVFDRKSNKLTQIGRSFPPSSLMFAKFSGDNQFVAYVQGFNIYREDFSSGEVKQLTFDGNGDVINGTFDWVYEEEFGCRDGFRWSPDGSRIAFWQVDASHIGTFYMINNTDSIYSQVLPVQYPKVGQDPSSARIGLVDTRSGTTEWVNLEGSTVQNYLPGMQWVNDDLLLIQQINRKQNHLKVWAYVPSSKATRLVYEEKEDTWVDIKYADVTLSNWGSNDLSLVEDNRAFLRMTEDEWRNAYKVDLTTGSKTRLSPDSYDVASIAGKNKSLLFYMASPDNNAQRYLYAVDLKGNQKARRLTPSDQSGINKYNISPNGKYAIHSLYSALQPTRVDLISLPDHKKIVSLVTNKTYATKLQALDLPSVEFLQVTTADGITIDGRMLLPPDFDPSGNYPVIFEVYGEPWGQVALDQYVGLWNIMLTQMGYVVISMDNRGVPSLNGSAWRKAIYRQIGRINIRDLGQAAQEILKKDFLDEERVGVWGWSGGGTSTLNLMFQYPDVFHTGVAVAFVANQLTYDNVYQERFMGLPQENMEDFVSGSPITHAENLKGNLLLIHGTADDNVHYQNMEMLVNELIRQNKRFDMMSYPNRSHGINEGENTRRHLYRMITDYFKEHIPVE